MSSLTMTYTRRQLAETLRTPVMFLTVVLVPVAVMLFFIVPFVGDNPSTMTYGTATMAVFAVMLACVGHFSISVAALRESAWGSYLRTLPGGLAPQAVGHLLVGMVVVAAAVVPIIVVAWLFTAANAPIGRVLLAVGALLITAVMFTFMGLAVGYLMGLAGTLIFNSVAFLPLSVAGGMFFDPENTPAFSEIVSPFIPTRGASDLVVAALMPYSPDPLALFMFGAWTVVFAVLFVWGYRRDEGRRFR